MADKEVIKDMSQIASYATKLFTAGAAMEITTEEVQALGRYGYTKELPVNE